MKQGYLVIAQNTKDSEGKTIDYVRMAYALALSIKHTQKGVNNVSVAVVNKKDVPIHYHYIFDEIISAAILFPFLLNPLKTGCQGNSLLLGGGGYPKKYIWS